MISFGVPAGAATAVQVAPWTSGKPASAMVGTSGSVGERVLPVTASARDPPIDKAAGHGARQWGVAHQYGVAKIDGAALAVREAARVPESATKY